VTALSLTLNFGVEDIAPLIRPSLTYPEIVRGSAQTQPNLPKREVTEDQGGFLGHVQYFRENVASMYEAPVLLYLLLRNQIEHYTLLVQFIWDFMRS